MRTSDELTEKQEMKNHEKEIRGIQKYFIFLRISQIVSATPNMETCSSRGQHFTKSCLVVYRVLFMQTILGKKKIYLKYL